MIPALVISILINVAALALSVIVLRRFRASADRYRSLFEAVPVMLRELDVSEVVRYLDELRERGVTDLARHFDENPGAFVHCARLARTSQVNPAFLRFRGVTAADEGDAALEDEMTPVHAEQVRRQLLAFWHGELLSRFETTVPTADGTARDLTVHVSRLGEDPTRLVFASVDMTERKRAEEALQRSEDRYRSLVEDQPDLVCRYRPDSRLTYTNRAFAEYFGGTIESLRELQFTTLVPGDARPVLRRIMAAMGPSRLVETFEHETLRADGATTWLEWTIRVFVDETGRVIEFQAFGRDVTRRKGEESRLRLLMEELNHRVKNTLASVLALSHTTLANADSMVDFGEKFEGRLHAMARMHEALAASRWTGVDLGEAIQLIVRPHAGSGGDRIRASGEAVRLPAEASSPLCLALHEMTTNAAKHGALSRPEGTIEIKWHRDGEHHLAVEWVESGMSDVVRPRKSGLGTRLIQGFIEHQLHGSVELDFAPGGLHGTFTIPLD